MPPRTPMSPHSTAEDAASSPPPPGAGKTDDAAAGGLFAQGRALLGALRDIAHDLPGLVGDRVELLALELQRAGHALLHIVLLLVAAAVLGVTAWLAAWAVAVLGLMAMGLPPVLALALAVAANGVAAAWALRAALARVRLVGLPATRRQLSFNRLAPTGPPAAPAPGATPPA